MFGQKLQSVFFLSKLIEIILKQKMIKKIKTDKHKQLLAKQSKKIVTYKDKIEV